MCGNMRWEEIKEQAGSTRLKIHQSWCAENLSTTVPHFYRELVCCDVFKLQKTIYSISGLPIEGQEERRKEREDKEKCGERQI